VTVIRSSDSAVKYFVKWLAMSYAIGDYVGTAAVAILKMLYLCIIIRRWDIAGIDTAFRQKKFYKVASGKSMKRSLTMIVFVTNKVLSNFKLIN